MHMTFLYIILAVNVVTWITMYFLIFKTPLLDVDEGDK